MMKSKMHFIALSLIAMMILGCEKTKIDDDKLYQGRVIFKDCPSIGIIEVTNASIGHTWLSGNKQYSNVIILANVPAEIDHIVAVLVLASYARKQIMRIS